jgi:hypothetical protein
MMEDDATPSLASVGMWWISLLVNNNKKMKEREGMVSNPLFAVQTIMETLSDAVNQLILLVIALQEQNSAMPAHIPPATVRKQ